MSLAVDVVNRRHTGTTESPLSFALVLGHHRDRHDYNYDGHQADHHNDGAQPLSPPCEHPDGCGHVAFCNGSLTVKRRRRSSGSGARTSEILRSSYDRQGELRRNGSDSRQMRCGFASTGGKSCCSGRPVLLPYLIRIGVCAHRTSTRKQGKAKGGGGIKRRRDPSREGSRFAKRECVQAWGDIMKRRRKQREVVVVLLRLRFSCFAFSLASLGTEERRTKKKGEEARGPVEERSGQERKSEIVCALRLQRSCWV
ncbi:hypothetical protein NL676_021866 [Syzygium grande]|nr:hypothetical protein NL676_021866 [Syzygium grande]